MSNTHLYIATTLDGFIARENGSLDWLMELPNPSNNDYGYTDFINTIDVIVMGRKTYEEILSFGIEWPYHSCRTFVVSSKNELKINSPNTELIATVSSKTIDKIKHKSTKSIWIVGGGNLITQFLNENAIDEMIISIVPIIIGSGIKLFPNSPKETKLTLLSSKSFDSGIVNLHYSCGNS